MGQFGNNVQIAINGVFFQMYKRLFKEFFYRGIQAAEAMKTSFFQDQKWIFSETPHAIEDQSFSQPLSVSQEGDGYHFRPRPPTTRIEFLESDSKRDSRDQRGTEMQWSNISKEIDSLLKEIQFWNSCNTESRGS